MEQKDISEPRFVLIEDDQEYPADEKTRWYWDTARPLQGDQPFVAVQCYTTKDPNAFVRHEELFLLFTDQAEYHAVCGNCRSTYGGMQWSGSTRNPGWRDKSQRYLDKHTRLKGWCEFCDPVFGNGGWRLR